MVSSKPERSAPAVGSGRGCSGAGWVTWATGPVVISPATVAAAGVAQTASLIRCNFRGANPKLGKSLCTQITDDAAFDGREVSTIAPWRAIQLTTPPTLIASMHVLCPGIHRLQCKNDSLKSPHVHNPLHTSLGSSPPMIQSLLTVPMKSRARA